MTRRQRQFVWIVCLSVLAAPLAWPPTAGAARFEDPDAAVEGGRDALDKWMGYPWYESATDGVRRIDVQSSQEGWFWEWLGDLISGLLVDLYIGDILYWLTWIALATLLAWITYLLIRSYLDREAGTAIDAEPNALVMRQAQIDRVEALPVRLERPQTDLLSEARRNYQQGNYDEAIIYLYSYELIELDKNQIIRLARGKTNRQYLQETHRRSTLGNLLQQTIVAFEDVFFGSRTLSRARFEACWSGLDRFQTHTAEVPA